MNAFGYVNPSFCLSPNVIRSLSANATRDSNAGYTIGARLLEIDGCDEGGFVREGRLSVPAVEGDTIGKELEDFVR